MDETSLRRDALTPPPDCSMTTQNKWRRCKGRHKRNRREYFRSL